MPETFLSFLLLSSLAVGAIDTDRRRVEQGLAQHYGDCAFFPQSLDELFVETSKTVCRNGGGSPPLDNNETNRAAVKALKYMPLDFRELDYDRSIKGYQSYKLE